MLRFEKLSCLFITLITIFSTGYQAQGKPENSQDNRKIPSGKSNMKAVDPSTFPKDIQPQKVPKTIPQLTPKGKRQMPSVPDLTKGGKRDKMHDWNLGPTGARGWMWAMRLRTDLARQILITKIDKGSPADGILKVGDVIIGVNGKNFSSDARIAFGKAITEAERERNKGILHLVRWRNNKTEHVQLKI